MDDDEIVKKLVQFVDAKGLQEEFALYATTGKLSKVVKRDINFEEQEDLLDYYLSLGLTLTEAKNILHMYDHQTVEDPEHTLISAVYGDSGAYTLLVYADDGKLIPIIQSEIQ